VVPQRSLAYFDFAQGVGNLAGEGGLILNDGAEAKDGFLSFNQSTQAAYLDAPGTRELSRRLGGVESLSIGGWFQCRRSFEQLLLRRGQVDVGDLGERLFPPDDTFINFCLGLDQHGFLLGTINGNGRMPFPHVTVNRVPELAWQQLVVVKTADGYHRFYQNGALVHTDRSAVAAPSRQKWAETDRGAHQSLWLSMPGGGLIGEAWIVGRALDESQVTADFGAKRDRYLSAHPGRAVAIREMFAQPPVETNYEPDAARSALLGLLGPFPEDRVALDPQVISEEDCGSYVRRKITIRVQPDDRMPAYLLIPKKAVDPAAAIICFYGTTGGAGKDTTVGISGRRPGDPPHSNLSFAIDLVRAGFVAMAPDYLRDGERIHPGDAPYDTTRFYSRFPNWSVHGKDVWDTMRAIDYLQSLDVVDGERIGMMGHSYGGHSTIFAAALEPRIRAAVANGPVSAFREHGMHWAVPRGAGNSQSLPAMRPYILHPERPLPVTFAEITALIAPRPLWVGQAVGERRPLSEQNYGFVRRVYETGGAADRVRFTWYAGDHDFPPPARAAAVHWFQRWLSDLRPSDAEE
jgi:dienelactone hydrolase